MQLQALRFLPEPEVNVLRNRVNIRGSKGSKVQRFKGSKPKFEWSHKAVKSNYINIYIIIYILI